MIRNFSAIVFIFSVISCWTVSASQQSNDENFLVVTDVHLDKSSHHKMVFNPSIFTKENDLDELTFKQLLTNISDNIKRGLIPQPTFVLFLGDVVGHKRQDDSALTSESSFFELLHKTFPNTPLLFVNGNNDSFQANYGPYVSLNQPGVYKGPGDVAMANGWADPFLSTGITCKQTNRKFPCMIVENSMDGYYAVYLEPKRRLIALNTTLFSPRRVGINERKAMEQMHWLDTQLHEAQLNHEAVLLAMHIPPGNNVYDNEQFWFVREHTDFLKLMSTYHAIIIGVLAGHTHKDEIKIIKDASNQNLAGIYITSALSTSHGNTPSIRTYYFSSQKEQWHLTDYDSFYFLRDPNDSIVLKKLYNFSDYYCDGKKNNMFLCLDNLTAEKMQRYY